MLESIPNGYIKAEDMLVSYIRQFKLILNADTGAYKSVGGFLSIGKQFYAPWDWRRFWGVTAFLSIMLAFQQITHIQVIDGGHDIFCGGYLILDKLLSVNV